jgi:hypothetical protein
MKRLLSQNNQFLIEDYRQFSGGKRSGSYSLCLTKTGEWTTEYKDAARFDSEKEADDALLKIVKIYEEKR